MYRFFVPMKKIPRTTHQQKQVHVVHGKPVFYEPNDLKLARQKFMANLARYIPDEKITGKIRLMINGALILMESIQMELSKIQSQTWITA